MIIYQLEPAQRGSGPSSTARRGWEVEALSERQEGNQQLERVQRVIRFQHSIRVLLAKHALEQACFWVS